jgi:hypothetical protein
MPARLQTHRSLTLSPRPGTGCGGRVGSGGRRPACPWINREAAGVLYPQHAFVTAAVSGGSAGDRESYPWLGMHISSRHVDDLISSSNIMVAVIYATACLPSGSAQSQHTPSSSSRAAAAAAAAGAYTHPDAPVLSCPCTRPPEPYPTAAGEGASSAPAAPQPAEQHHQHQPCAAKGPWGGPRLLARPPTASSSRSSSSRGGASSAAGGGGCSDAVARACRLCITRWGYFWCAAAQQPLSSSVASSQRYGC